MMKTRPYIIGLVIFSIYSGVSFSMNSDELVETIAKDAGISKEQASRVMTSFTNTIEKSLIKGEQVNLAGFGTFLIKTRPARVGRNPRTGKTVNIPARDIPVFKAGKYFKDVVNSAHQR